jgi:hypothetical protein
VYFGTGCRDRKLSVSLCVFVRRFSQVSKRLILRLRMDITRRLLCKCHWCPWAFSDDGFVSTGGERTKRVFTCSSYLPSMQARMPFYLTHWLCHCIENIFIGNSGFVSLHYQLQNGIGNALLVIVTIAADTPNHKEKSQIIFHLPHFHIIH